VLFRSSLTIYATGDASPHVCIADAQFMPAGTCQGHRTGMRHSQALTSLHLRDGNPVSILALDGSVGRHFSL
jgi:hypothetical protein